MSRVVVALFIGVYPRTVTMSESVALLIALVPLPTNIPPSGVVEAVPPYAVPIVVPFHVPLFITLNQESPETVSCVAVAFARVLNPVKTLFAVRNATACDATVIGVMTWE